MRPRWRSLRARTTVAAAGIVAVAMALGAWLIVEQQRHALLDTVETTARLRVEDLASQLEDGALPESLAVPFGDESFAQVVDAQGRVVRASENVSGERAVIAFVPEAGGSDARSVTATPLGNATFRVVARAVDAPVGGFVIYVGQSTGPVVEGSRALMRSLLFGVPLLVLLVGVVAWSVSGRALRPVVRMRREVDSITERDLHRRLAEPGTDDEIAGLAHTMNSMLDRLDAAVYRQRRFVSDASHELRSPLTAMRAQIEVNLAHPERADWQSAGQELLQDAMRLQRLVEDLLVLARADRPDAAMQREPADIDDLVLREVRRIRQRGAVTIDAAAVSAVQTNVDRDALTRVVHNLLDNAERHARTMVTVSLMSVGDGIELVVRDDGPGVPTMDRERIFERFARSDEARGRDSGGSGLGLAIAREIAHAHGGTLELLDTDSGATFRLTLPR